MNLSAIVEEYEEQIPLYTELAETVRGRIRESLEDSRIKFELTSRAKCANNLAKKMVRKGYKNLDEVTDRAGVRLVLFHQEDIAKALAQIRPLFADEIISYDDKSSGLQSDRFGYRGIHIQFRLDSFRVASDKPPMECELQVRTAAEDLWSVAFHETFYKSGIKLPDALERRLHRLGALVELFDEQCSLARKEVGEVDGSQLLALVNHVRATYEDLREMMVEQDLVPLVVSTLFENKSLDEVTHVTIPSFDAFVQTNSDKITSLWKYNTEVGKSNPFLLDASSLLVWFMLSNERYLLRDEWSRVLDTGYLYQLADVWGSPYSDS